MSDTPKVLDQSALRVNQGAIIVLLALAFTLNFVPLVGVTALVMALGTGFGRPGFALVYWGFLKPLGWVKPDPLVDLPQPHRFAQGFGAVVLLLATLAFWTGLGLVGWILTTLVAILAALNLFVGFCAGCFVYYQLGKLGVAGFKKPLESTSAGDKP